MTTVKLIYAVADDLTIGVGGRLPWHSPVDLINFKTATTGHCVAMGRRTFDTLPAMVRPLPGRDTVVITHHLERDMTWHSVWSARSVEDAIKRAELLGHKDIWFCGGVGVIEAAVPYASEAYVTHVGMTVGTGADIARLNYRIEADPIWTNNELVDEYHDGYTYRKIHYKK
jgi:dihydrofolate reductase